MNDDWLQLKRELDRVDGRIFDFGSFSGWRVEQVCTANPRKRTFHRCSQNARP
jgi:hypothetical protein